MTLPSQTGNPLQLFLKRKTELAPTKEPSLSPLNVGALKENLQYCIARKTNKRVTSHNPKKMPGPKLNPRNTHDLLLHPLPPPQK